MSVFLNHSLNSQCLQQELIDYMFRRDEIGKLDAEACLKLWFGKSHDTDNEIRKRYSHLVDQAISGELDDWMETPHGCLALMILTDQFPRNMYRHTVQMYSGDQKSMEILARGHDWTTKLTPEECLFVPCLILTHQENLEDQKQCVEYYERIESDLMPEFRSFRTIFEAHLKIINICGVFPHRDHYFGRETSEAGKLLLEDPTLRFDLPLVSESGSVQFGTDPSRLWQATIHTFDVLDRLNSLAQKYKHSDASHKSSNIDWMTDEQVAFCKDTFRKFDKNGDNSLSVDELLSVLNAVGRPYSIERVQEAIDIITDHSGRLTISFEEFATLVQSDLLSHEDEQLLERFQLFDVDGSGTISLEELRICIRNHDSLITNTEIESMLKRADSDGDGHIDYHEFYALIQAARKGNTHSSN